MAMNTPRLQKQYRAATTVLNTLSGDQAVTAVDITKNTLVVFDGSTRGGHPLAKEARKIVAGTPNVKINDGAEASLSGDITIKVLPGTIPGGMVQVTNPAGQPEGEYLEVSYTDTDGTAKKYYVSLSKLVDKYLAGEGIKIDGNTISVDAAKLVTDVAATGGGLVTDAEGNLVVDPTAFIDAAKGLAVTDGKVGVKLAADGGLKLNAQGELVAELSDVIGSDADGPIQVENGKVVIDVSQLIDPDGPLSVTEDGKLTVKLISADAGNNLKAGSDGGVFFPSDFGTLE